MNLGQLLQTHPEFSGFSQAELNTLEQALSVLDYPDGYEFLVEGQRGTSMYLIIEGEVVATRRKTRQRGVEVIKKLASGDLFGLTSLIYPHHRLESFVAVGPVKVASLPSSAFNLLFMANSPIGYHFQYVIARQLAHDIQRCTEALVSAVKTGDRSRLNEVTPKS